MSLKFNIDRPKVSDEEISKHKDFQKLVEKFKQQSLKKAQGDETWWKHRKIRYSTVIAGITVVCTVTYFSLFNKSQTTTNDKINTQKTISTSTPKKTVSPSAPFINVPATKLKTPYASYKVNNGAGGTITHPTSTRLKIPKNSFVDKSGKSIVGDVTIEYREFHDVADVIINGIPMAYDSAGKKYNLETAGMFDIRGTKDGEPVFIAPGKDLKVELASKTDESRFNQYYLDTIERNWKYIQKDEAVKKSTVAQPVQSAADKLEVLRNEFEKVIPRKIDSVGVVYKTKVERLPDHKAPATPKAKTAGRPTFKLDGSYDEFPELSAFNNVLFEVGPENRNYSKELHEITWSDVKVTQGPVKGVNYVLNLKYRDRSEKLVVYPVLEGKDLEKAKEEHNKKFTMYEALEEKKVAEEKRLLAELESKQAMYLAEQKKIKAAYEEERAKKMQSTSQIAENELSSNFNKMSMRVKANRIFTIANFGIFNSDCPHTVPQGDVMTPIFISEAGGHPVIPDQIFLVDHNRKTVFNYNAATGIRFQLDSSAPYTVCVFTKNTMYLCKKENFQRARNAKSSKFIVEALPDNADHISELKKALEI